MDGVEALRSLSGSKEQVRAAAAARLEELCADVAGMSKDAAEATLFLAAYDPLRESISFVANRVLNVPGQQLGEAIDHLKQRIPAVITAEALTRGRAYAEVERELLALAGQGGAR